MKKIMLYLALVVLTMLFLSRCVICKMRWSDSKATKVFKSKNVPVIIKDTIINGHHVHYAMTGNDSLPSLVFIHGSPGSWFHYMKYMWDTSLLKKFRVISFDRPGFGYSNYGRAMHLQDQSKLLLPVLQKLKSDKPMFLCGHSMGGPVVAQLAADDPSLFKTVIIAAGSLDPKLEKKETWRHVMDVKPLFWFLPGAFQPSNTELLYLKEDLKPLAADLSKITTNILFVHGDMDTWVPIENVAYGKKMMVNAASITVDTIFGANHHFPWKRRDDFIKILTGLN